LAHYNGTSADNYIQGSTDSDTLFGLEGNDLLEGLTGADALDGGTGRDAASYRTSTGVRVALDNSFAATGDASGDTFMSIEDVEGSLTGHDVLSGNANANRLFGFGGDDRLYGRSGNDQLLGADGNDQLFGGLGSDVLNGSDGNDLLAGGPGRDTINGGDGTDLFRYYNVTEGGDKIVSFAADDILQFSQLSFAGTHIGKIGRDAFWTNATGLAHDQSDRFIFDAAHHVLRFDSNGSAPGGIHSAIATFYDSTPSTFSDIHIF
jgi:Ca2+-binding RTX toxin-like protein